MACGLRFATELASSFFCFHGQHKARDGNEDVKVEVVRFRATVSSSSASASPGLPSFPAADHVDRQATETGVVMGHHVGRVGKGWWTDQRQGVGPGARGYRKTCRGFMLALGHRHETNRRSDGRWIRIRSIRGPAHAPRFPRRGNTEVRRCEPHVKSKNGHHVGGGCGQGGRVRGLTNIVRQGKARRVCGLGTVSDGSQRWLAGTSCWERRIRTLLSAALPTTASPRVVRPVVRQRNETQSGHKPKEQRHRPQRSSVSARESSWT